MTYKIGTRVRKVKGNRNIGRTGTVCGGPAADGAVLAHGSDIYVRFDAGWVSSTGEKWGSGTVATTVSSCWEPIIPDGHRAGVKGECSLLDELLSREVKNEAV